MNDRISPLLADLYSFTMAAAYFVNGKESVASFELFARSLPLSRSYLIAAGLERALQHILNLHFQEEEVEYFRKHPSFQHLDEDFFHRLRELRFTGDVWAVPEGTPIFPQEPILRITAPILEAQILEAVLLNIIGFETGIASKTARVIEAAKGRPVTEFGCRHAHGPDAALHGARAAYLAGASGTSDVLAGMRYGIPTSGTMAHSFIMAYEDEAESFAEFSRVFPEHSIILLDTYDTMRGLERMISLDLHPIAVRLDSGDLLQLSREVRRRLDAAGLEDVKIFVTGNLDEYKITDLLTAGAPIDAFGVGTELSTSQDYPALGCVYKLVHIHEGPEPRGRAKLSAGKLTYPSCKQVFRFRNSDGSLHHDLVASIEEQYPEAEPLLHRYIHQGQQVKTPASLSEAREACKAKRTELPQKLRDCCHKAKYEVEISTQLKHLLAQVQQRNIAQGE